MMVVALIVLLGAVAVLWYLSSPHRRTRLRGLWLKRQVERGKAQWGRQRAKPHAAPGRARGGVGGVVMKGRAKISAKIKRGSKSRYYTGDDAWHDLGTLWEGDIQDGNGSNQRR